MTRLYKTGETVRVEGYQADLRRWFTAQYSRVGEPGSRLFAVVFNDVTKRKQHEQQQEYLMKLSDMLRPLSDPAEVQQLAMGMLGNHLNVDRAIYVDINSTQDFFEAKDSYSSRSVRKMTGRFPFSVFGPPSEVLKKGETLVIDDIDAMQYGADVKKSFLSIDVQAVVAVPLIKNGVLVAAFPFTREKPESGPPMRSNC